MRQFWTRERLKTLIVYLILCAVVDSAAFVRAYAGDNADTVSIVANGDDGYPAATPSSGSPSPGGRGGRG
ncbi:MAG: hypothetical protein ACRDHE_11210 [Ktedonobacterales bacterium]